jgi:hypothetical protein
MQEKCTNLDLIQTRFQFVCVVWKANALNGKINFQRDTSVYVTIPLI